MKMIYIDSKGITIAINAKVLNIKNGPIGVLYCPASSLFHIAWVFVKVPHKLSEGAPKERAGGGCWRGPPGRGGRSWCGE